MHEASAILMKVAEFLELLELLSIRYRLGEPKATNTLHCSLARLFIPRGHLKIFAVSRCTDPKSSIALSFNFVEIQRKCTEKTTQESVGKRFSVFSSYLSETASRSCEILRTTATQDDERFELDSADK